jgi:hypothetical protein
VPAEWSRERSVVLPSCWHLHGRYQSADILWGLQGMRERDSKKASKAYICRTVDRLVVAKE